MLFCDIIIIRNPIRDVHNSNGDKVVDKDDGGSSAAVVLLLFILVLIIVGCVFIKCKKTKSGPEVRNFYAL